MNKDAKRIKPALPYWAKRKFFCDGCQKEHGLGVFQNKTLDGKHLCDRQYYKMKKGEVVKMKNKKETFNQKVACKIQAFNKQNKNLRDSWEGKGDGIGKEKMEK